MMQTVRGFLAPVARLAIGVLALAAAGCDSGGFASELTTRPKPRLLKAEPPSTLRLPQDEAFSIALAPSQEAPALGGEADGDASVAKEGNASASAKVTNGGAASGSFQLGHAVENDSDRQIDLDIVTKLRYEYEAEAQSGTAASDAVVGLKLYARDRANRLVRDLTLVQHATDQGSSARSGDESLKITLTLGPHDTMTVFVAGQALVETSKNGRSARSSLKISDLKIEMTPRPAPAVRTASDERK